MRGRRVLRILKVALIALVAFTVFGFVVTHLWNYLMPGLFGLRIITFWQAVGLMVLGRLLFGGFRPGRGGVGWGRRGGGATPPRRGPESTGRFGGGGFCAWGVLALPKKTPNGRSPAPRKS